jgi:hypothetical protein
MNGILRTLMPCLFAVAMGLHACGFTMILKHSHGHEECSTRLFLHYNYDEQHHCHHHDAPHNHGESEENDHDQENPEHHHACSFCKQLQGLEIFLFTFHAYPPQDFRLFLRWEPMMPDKPVLERDIPPVIA